MATTMARRFIRTRSSLRYGRRAPLGATGAGTRSYDDRAKADLGLGRRAERRSLRSGGSAPTYHSSMIKDPTRRRASRLIAIASASIAGLLLLVAGSFDANAATVTVSAADFSFQPASRSVHVGDVVRWTFGGDPHTVTSGSPGAPDGAFDSGIKAPGGTFQVTFRTTGTFRYFCQIHPEQMTGTIVVSAGATQKPTVRPTARPTASPTASPTAKPTAKVAATATATTAPATATASPIAIASPATTATPAPAATAAAITSPSPSAAPSTTPAPNQSATPGPDGSAAGGTFDPVPALVLAIVVGLLVAGAIALLRRPRRPDRPI